MRRNIWNPGSRIVRCVYAVEYSGRGAGYRDRLFRAVRHAATGDAVVVLRSFGEPPPELTGNYAAEDRAMLWGVVDVRSLLLWFSELVGFADALQLAGMAFGVVGIHFDELHQGHLTAFGVGAFAFKSLRSEAFESS